MSEGKIVVDTNVVSHIMKGDELGRAYALHLQGKLASVFSHLVRTFRNPLSSITPTPINQTNPI